MRSLVTESIGWMAAVILLATVGRQVYTQWRTRSTRGLSRWLFLGQLAASAGFVVYSVLVENWIFVATNAFMLATAALGQWIYLRNRAIEAHRGSVGDRPR